MQRFDPDAALRSAADAESAEAAREGGEKSAAAQRIAEYRAYRNSVRDKLVHTGERVLERLIDEAEGRGIESLLIERSLLRKTYIDGWILKRYPGRGAGLVMLLGSGEVVNLSSHPRELFLVVDRSTIPRWVDGQLSAARGGGDKPPPEAWFLKSTTIWYADESLGRSLRVSLQQIERDTMAAFLKVLRSGGIQP